MKSGCGAMKGGIFDWNYWKFYRKIIGSEENQRGINETISNTSVKIFELER